MVGRGRVIGLSSAIFGGSPIDDAHGRSSAWNCARRSTFERMHSYMQTWPVGDLMNWG